MIHVNAWFARYPDLAECPLFEIEIPLTAVDTAVVKAYEGPQDGHHNRVYCELLWKGEILFPKEFFYVGIPGNHTIDGNYAKSAVLSLFSLKPGDIDAEFFQDHTQEQIDFVCLYADEISILSEELHG
jgi:hypothetical protein